MREHRPVRARVREWAPPVALVVLYAVVQATYLRPVSPQDAMRYFERAAAFPDVPADHWGLRIGLLVPVRLAQWMLGYSEAAYYAVPLLSSALLIVAVYWLGRLLFAPAVGVGAAVVVLSSGVFLNTSSAILPDVPAAALFTTGVTLLIRELTTGRSRPRTLIAAGLLVAWSYLTREYVAFLLPVVPLAWWAFRAPWRRLVWVAAPAAAVFVGEMALNWTMHGNPLRRLFVTGSHGRQDPELTETRFDAFVRLPQALADIPGGDVVLVMLVLLPLALALSRPAGVVLLGWFATLWVPITLWSGFIDPSFRVIDADKTRYWTLILPAVAVAGVAVLYYGARSWWTRSGGRGAAIPAVLAIGLIGWLAVVGSTDERAREIYRANGADHLPELRHWLTHEGRDVGVVWTDCLTARLMPLYTRSTLGNQVWHGDVRTFDRSDGSTISAESIDEGVVVLYASGSPVDLDEYPGLASFLDVAPGDPSILVRRPDESLVIFDARRRASHVPWAGKATSMEVWTAPVVATRSHSPSGGGTRPAARPSWDGARSPSRSWTLPSSYSATAATGSGSLSIAARTAITRCHLGG